jgi:hypothetical protein
LDFQEQIGEILVNSLNEIYLMISKESKEDTKIAFKMITFLIFFF